jgi:putative PIN family toxin of toxin-antitoxin system
MKAVLDTTVIVSALIAPSSPPARIVVAWQAGRFEIVTARPLLTELEEVAQRPETNRFFHRSADWVATLRQRLRDTATIVVPGEVHVVDDDPDDDIVLGTASAGDADDVVTGDRHLLALGSFRGIPIVTPWQFLQVLAAEESGATD